VIVGWEPGADESRAASRILSTVPVIGRVSGYRFFFYSNENDEPPHVHVQRERKLAKFWLKEVSLAKSKRFMSHELTEIEKIVAERQQQFLEAWYEHFNG